MRLEDLYAVSDDEIIAEFRRQASTTVLNVSSLQNELQRRSTEKLIHATQAVDRHAADLIDANTRLAAAAEGVLRSSHGLETLTKLLILLTVLLLLAAVPPATEGIMHWFQTAPHSSNAP